MIPFNLIGEEADLSLFEMLLQCSRELVGAGCRLGTALNALYSANDLVNGHSDCKSGNALSVARAASVVFYCGDHVVLNSDLDASGANALGCVNKSFFHINLCILSINYS